MSRNPRRAYDDDGVKPNGRYQRVNRTAPAREAIPHTTAGSSSSPQVSTIRLDGLFVALTTS
jgi:hypothetical protein